MDIFDTSYADIGHTYALILHSYIIARTLGRLSYIYILRTYTRHIIYWLAVFILWTVMKSGGNWHYKNLLISAAHMPFYMMAFYYLRYFQIPHLYQKHRPVLFVLSFVVSTLVFSFLWTLSIKYLDYILGDLYRTPFLFMKVGGYIIENVQFYAPAVALLAWESYHERKEELARLTQLEKENITHELKLLKAQVNPNFLFNTLKNLYAQVVAKSPDAPDMVMRLSHLLDFVLYKSQKPFVPLQEEVGVVEDFLWLEQIRLKDRLSVSFHKPNSSSLQISPLIILNLLRSILQRIQVTEKNEIEIELSEIEQTIQCRIRTRPPQVEPDGTENEVQDVYRQLSFVYPGRHELTVTPSSMHLEYLLIIDTTS